MNDHPCIEAMLSRASVRRYKPAVPADDVIEAVALAGRQAPFATQSYSVLLSREPERHPFNAPLYFIVCVDFHKFDRIMQRRGWKPVLNDLFRFLLGAQDAAYCAQNMVQAAEALGMGTCFIGFVPMQAKALRERWKLPSRVFPLVGLTMGYPDETPPPRPRFPLSFTLFEGRYPDFTDEQLDEAACVMDEGYLAQDYYRKLNAMIKLPEGMDETFDLDNYSWTEHICRKIGLWAADPAELLRQFEACGFELTTPRSDLEDTPADES
ncbi:MAG: nitroreductase family protein [Candidatus Cloacimonetes bacterium]|nr:nitroreductase family protein [Candidatus Cloacimonadota bacterium]